MPKRLSMVVDHFKNKDAVAVDSRFRDTGRVMPEELMPALDILTKQDNTPD